MYGGVDLCGRGGVGVDDDGEWERAFGELSDPCSPGAHSPDGGMAGSCGERRWNDETVVEFDKSECLVECHGELYDTCDDAVAVSLPVKVSFESLACPPAGLGGDPYDSGVDAGTHDPF